MIFSMSIHSWKNDENIQYFSHSWKRLIWGYESRFIYKYFFCTLCSSPMPEGCVCQWSLQLEVKFAKQAWSDKDSYFLCNWEIDCLCWSWCSYTIKLMSYDQFGRNPLPQLSDESTTFVTQNPSNSYSESLV